MVTKKPFYPRIDRALGDGFHDGDVICESDNSFPLSSPIYGANEPC
jgi:hypothetical protein